MIAEATETEATTEEMTMVTMARTEEAEAATTTINRAAGADTKSLTGAKRPTWE